MEVTLRMQNSKSENTSKQKQTNIEMYLHCTNLLIQVKYLENENCDVEKTSKVGKLKVSDVPDRLSKLVLYLKSKLNSKTKRKQIKSGGRSCEEMAVDQNC